MGVVGCTAPGNDKIIAFIDGARVGQTWIVTKHGYYDFSGSARVGPGTHTLKLVWFAAGRELKTLTTTVTG